MKIRFEIKIRYKIEQLGKHNSWNAIEQRGNPVACPLVGEYLANVQKDQRRATVLVKRAPPVVVGVSRKIVIDMPRGVATLRTTAEHFAVVRVVANICGALHTRRRGFELSVVVGAQVLQTPGRGEGFIFNFLVGKTLQVFSQEEVLARRNID